MRTVRRIATLMTAALSVVLLVPTPANALEVFPQRLLHFTTPLVGTADPYSLEVIARDLGTSADLQVNLTRKATTTNHPIQQHSWYVQNLAFSCTGGTQRCELDTGAHMGSYGTIHLVFNGTGAVTTTHHGCPNVDRRDNTHAVRTGRVTGTFQLATGTGYFGTILNQHSAPVHIASSIAANADRITYGSDCPSSSSTCARQLFAGILGDTQGVISAYQFQSSHSGSALWNVDDPTVTADVQVVHRVFGRAHATVVKATSNSPATLQAVAVKLPLAPFLTGHGTIVATTPPSRLTNPGCRQTSRNGTFTGRFKVTLDGYGTYAVNGSVAAEVTRYVPH